MTIEGQKTIKVSFDEQSKAVTASVTIEHHNPTNSQEVLKEAEELFAQAYKTAQRYTLDKAR